MPSLENFTVISRAEYESGLEQKVLEQAVHLHALYVARFKLKHQKHEAAANPVRVEQIGTHRLGGAAIGLSLLDYDLKTFYEAEGRMVDGVWSPDKAFVFVQPVQAGVASGYLVDYDDGIPPEFRLATSRPLELAGAGGQ